MEPGLHQVQPVPEVFQRLLHGLLVLEHQCGRVPKALLHGLDRQHRGDGVRLLRLAPHGHEAGDELLDAQRAAAVGVQDFEEPLAVRLVNLELVQELLDALARDDGLELVARHLELRVGEHLVQGLLLALPAVPAPDQAPQAAVGLEALVGRLEDRGLRLGVLSVLCLGYGELADHHPEFSCNAQVLRVPGGRDLLVVGPGRLHRVLDEDGHDEVEYPNRHEEGAHDVAHQEGRAVATVEVHRQGRPIEGGAVVHEAAEERKHRPRHCLEGPVLGVLALARANELPREDGKHKGEEHEQHDGPGQYS
mmetsp:Transcript_112534/g.318364  ORF Transcript_112534/g.318364 Transcript_112534/m.318364 type:complete len:307 (-) Transcript_112534:1409-2329(-)